MFFYFLMLFFFNDNRPPKGGRKFFLSYKGFVLLSGYESKMYDSLLKDWHKETHINYSQAGSKKQEVLWMNFEPPAQLSIFDL